LIGEERKFPTQARIVVNDPMRKWGETGREDEIDAIIARGGLRPKYGWKLILLLAFSNFR